MYQLMKLYFRLMTGDD